MKEEGGFVIHDEFSTDWDSWVSLTESGILHSAAESGLVEIVKILLKLGADPLSIVGKYRGNDETVIHAIHRNLCRTERGLGLSSECLGPQNYMSDDLRKRITKVLDVMMKHANCTDICPTVIEGPLYLKLRHSVENAYTRCELAQHDVVDHRGS